MIEISDEWMIHPTILGEGAFGEVKLIIHKKTHQKVACKTILYKNHVNAELCANKEVAIHRLLHHENIIRFYNRKVELDRQHLYLEYADSGELFQMIDPGIGMPSSSAQSYMRQLLNGLKYIHSKGIVHRDIKPENLLINCEGVLKICDFGMATLFKCKGKERLLDKRCGTQAYLAPEVLTGSYHGEPADVWSCGIVLIAMLTGELPWHNLDSEEFEQYRQVVYITQTPWTRLTNYTVNLIRKILDIEPRTRFRIDEILNHRWMNVSFDYDSSTDDVDGEGESRDGTHTIKPWHSVIDCEVARETPDVTLSQPVPPTRAPPITNDPAANVLNNGSARDHLVCFSQPIHNEDLIVSSQLTCTQSPITRENFHVLMRRLTRFYVKTTTHAKTVDMLCGVLNGLHYTWQMDVAGAVSISTVDSMRIQLNFKANIIEMDGKFMIDFRLSRGCGLEFKKKFKKLKECLSNFIVD